MAILITPEEALELLRKNRRHYLWNKHISKWTKRDVYNLRNGINIFIDKEDLKVHKKRTFNEYSFVEGGRIFT